MPDASPYAVRCPATNRHGEQCRRVTIGGGVCRYHGGNAPQVRAKREARVAAAMLADEAAKLGQGTPDATPAEMLLAAARSAHRVVGLLSDRAGTAPSPEQLETLGPWLDRLSRAAAAVVSSKADELVIAQAARVADGQARVMFRAVEATVSRLGLTPDQRAKVPDALRAALVALGLAPDPEATPDALRPPTGRPALAVVRGEVEP